MKHKHNRRLLPLLLPLLCMGSAPALAHRASDALLQLELNGSQVQGVWTIALRDLELAYGLDGNSDGRISWGEVQARADPLVRQLGQELHLASEAGPCPHTLAAPVLRARDDGPALSFALTASCPAPPAQLELEYRFLFALDSEHRGLIALRAGDRVQSAVLSPDAPRRRFALAAPAAAADFTSYLAEGVHHIAIGADHGLFLLALLLGASLRREGGSWVPEPHFKTALGRAAAIVTAFTAAHSLSLGLAVFGWLSLPARLVESAIAASVLAAALNNLWPWVRRLGLMTFGFGLVHGLGFAGVLAELGLPPATKGLALLGFNLGVELGQLAGVALVLPLLFALRGWRAYRPGVLAGGSLAIAGLALIWLVERAAGVELVSGL